MDDPSAVIPADVVIPTFSKFTELPFYFEVTIVKVVPGCNIGIGLVDKFHDMKGTLGINGISFGYFPLANRTIAHTEKIPRDYGAPYPTDIPRSVIGCGFDAKAGVVFYTVNGNCYGVAFRNVSGTFFPAVSLDTALTEVTVNFGQSMFQYSSKFWVQDKQRIIGVQLCRANNICTFVATKDEYAPQNMFGCETCKYVGNLGMCSVCAVTCHAGHTITKGAFNASFYCDCGSLKKCTCLKEDLYAELVKKEKDEKEKS